MPTVAENRAKWSEHKWSLAGHEWSPGGTLAGTQLLWSRSIRSRIASHLPAATLLEIAPGFGRWTAYLIDECERLIGVDVTDRCVETCRERFAESPHAEFWVNDGESLPMVGSASIDFAFSFDSLVHVEASQVHAYLRELVRKLKPGASGFFHHSNLGAYAQGSGSIPSYITRTNWRAPSMSARVFREACRAVGLRCVSQEVINWIPRGPRADRHKLSGGFIPLTDCLSTFVRPDASVDQGPTRIYINPHFVDEWRQLIVLSLVYGGFDGAVNDSGQIPRRGLRAVAGRLARRALDVSERFTSRAREEAMGRVYAYREPIVRRILSGICPDCGARLQRSASRSLCQHCDALFVLD